MYKLLGITDETTTCECCGKTNLKSVVVLQMVDGGEIVRYGSQCAAKALRGNGYKGVRADVLLDDAKAVALANKWLAAGHDLAVIGRGIGNRFGYQWQVKDNALHIGNFAVIRKPVTKPVFVIAEFYTRCWNMAA